MNRSLIVAVALAAGGALWIASGAFLGEDGQAAQDPEAALPAAAETAPPPMAVRVAHYDAQPRAAEIVVLGLTEASRTVVVRAETDGRVVSLPVEEGAVVDAEAALAGLDLAEREARLAEVKALLKQREAELNAATTLAREGFQTEIRAAEMEALAEAARAALRAIEIDLARTTIRAPFAGVVDQRAVDLGDFVQRGDPVATVVDLDPLIVAAEVSERDVGQIAVGQQGQARLVDGRTVAGRVRYVARVGASETRTFRVELEIANPDRRVPAGATAELRLPVAEVQAHLLSPAVLTLDDAGNIGVKVVDAEGVVGFHAVALVADSPEGVWVTGLPPAVDVITVGQEFVRPGQRVAPVKAD